MNIHRGVLSLLCATAGLVIGLWIAGAYLDLQGAPELGQPLWHFAMWPGALFLILFSFVPFFTEEKVPMITEVKVQRDSQKNCRNFGTSHDHSMLEKS